MTFRRKHVLNRQGLMSCGYLRSVMSPDIPETSGISILPKEIETLGFAKEAINHAWSFQLPCNFACLVVIVACMLQGIRKGENTPGT
jgi:hypothetical protein